MSLIEKIQANSLLARLEKTKPENHQAKKPEPETESLGPGPQLRIDGPLAPCPTCRPPFGRTFWRDAYGAWHCWGCDPPAAQAQVRDECEFQPDGSLPEPEQDLWRLSPGFFVTAVFFPDGTEMYNPNLTPRQRRDAGVAFTGWGWSDSLSEGGQVRTGPAGGESGDSPGLVCPAGRFSS